MLNIDCMIAEDAAILKLSSVIDIFIFVLVHMKVLMWYKYIPMKVRQISNSFFLDKSSIAAQNSKIEIRSFNEISRHIDVKQCLHPFKSNFDLF